MFISDLIFGEFEVTEPVLLELLNSPEISRLKEISSAGYYPAQISYSNEQGNRWHHSLGVFLLLRRFGASIEEQIAGLIHDVSHSAFSHTIDYIKKDLEQQKVQGAQDCIHDDFVKNSSLKNIIEKHGFNIDYILDDSHFTLKENNLPDICADRLEYALRQAHIVNLLNLTEIHQIISDLRNNNGSFVFGNLESAEKYVGCFHWLNDNYWSGLSSAVMFSISAKMFRHALEQNYVSFSDFYLQGDNYIISRIETFLEQDIKLKNYYNLLHLTPDNFVSRTNAQIEPIYIKNRIVNPYVITTSGLKRIGDLNAQYASKICSLPKSKKYYICQKDLSLAV